MLLLILFDFYLPVIRLHSLQTGPSSTGSASRLCRLNAPVRKVSLYVHCRGTVCVEVSEHLAGVRVLAFHLAVSRGWTRVVRLGSKSLLTHKLSHWPRRALLLFFSKAFCSFGLTVAVGSLIRSTVVCPTRLLVQSPFATLALCPQPRCLASGYVRGRVLSALWLEWEGRNLQFSGTDSSQGVCSPLGLFSPLSSLCSSF